MPSALRHLIPAAAYTAAGNTGNLSNLSIGDDSAVVAVDINCTAVAGTTPSLTPTLEASADGGTTWYPLQVGTAITAVSHQRLLATSVLEDLVRVSWPAPTGTTPSLTIAFTFLFQ